MKPNAFPPLRAAPRWTCALAIAACSIALGLDVAAQGPPGPYTTALLWVDDDGDDVAGTGAVGSPYRTIGHAIAMAGTSGHTGHTVIMVKPGVYDDSPLDARAQPEVFPLVMQKNVSLQGAGALDTVISSSRFAAPNPNEVLIVFRAATVNEFQHTYIDGFNIHNEPPSSGIEAQTGILIENTGTAPFSANPTISNCFFTDHETAAIDIVSAPNGDPLDLASYVPHRPRILFCTFRFNVIGVRNRTSQAVTHGGITAIWGANQPGLLNCLFVDQLVNGGDDLQGIDRDDLRVGGINSTAFEQANSEPGAPSLLPPGVLPVSKVNLAPIATRLFVDTVTNGPGANDDLRLNPGLKLEITGFDQTPIDSGLDPGNSWTWDNNTSASRDDLTDFSGDAFDWDCEGYGNPRIVDYILSTSFGGPDIGADEVGYLVIGGFDHSTRFRKQFLPYDPMYPAPNIYYWFQYQSLISPPTPAHGYSARLRHTDYSNLLAPLLYTLFGGNIPSIRPVGTTIPTQPPLAFGPNYLPLNAPYVDPVTIYGFPMVFTSNDLYNYLGWWQPGETPGNPVKLHNEQATLYDVLSGDPNNPLPTRTNLQTFRL